MDLPASPPPTSPTPPAPSLAVDAEAVAIPASDDEAAGAAPAHRGGDNAVLIDDADGVDAAPAHYTVKRKRGRPKKVLPVAEVYGGEEAPVAVEAVETAGKRKRGRPLKTPVPPPVSAWMIRMGMTMSPRCWRRRRIPGGKWKQGRPRKSAGVAAVTQKKGKSAKFDTQICVPASGSVVGENNYPDSMANNRQCMKISYTQICESDSGSVVGNNYPDSMANNRQCMKISYNTTDTVLCKRFECRDILNSYGPDLPYETYHAALKCIANYPEYAEEFLLQAPENHRIDWLDDQTPDAFRGNFKEWSL